MSPTGYWLIELQSTSNPDITFHLPYNRRQLINELVKVDELPKIESYQAKFGREISSSEQKQYPIQKLLKILGFSIDDFPSELKKYTKYYYPRLYSTDDDFDWEDDDY